MYFKSDQVKAHNTFLQNVFIKMILRINRLTRRTVFYTVRLFITGCAHISFLTPAKKRGVITLQCVSTYILFFNGLTDFGIINLFRKVTQSRVF